jgi:hypothetical protein
VSTPANLVEKTLWWTKWQTWFAGLGVLLAVVFGWSTVWRVLAATWAGLTAGVRVPVWLVAVLLLGTAVSGARWVHRLWRWWMPLAVPPVEAARPRRQTQVDPVVEEIDGVQWRGTLYDGKVDRLSAHCPKCLFKIDPKDHHGYRNSETVYFCDGCRDYKVQIPGTSFKIEDRITRLIEAGWLQRQESTKAGRG